MSALDSQMNLDCGAGLTKAGLHLIDDKEDVVLFQDLLELAEELRRGVAVSSLCKKSGMSVRDLASQPCRTSTAYRTE